MDRKRISAFVYLQPDITDPRRIGASTSIVNLSQRKKPAALSRILRLLGQST